VTTFLTKPVEYMELLARVEALLKVRHLNRDLDRALAYLDELELARHLPQSEPPPAQGDSPIGAPVILMVDDEALFRNMLCDTLQSVGYVTHAAENGQQALEIAQREALDVVLLDITMPGMSGLEVLAKLGERTPDSAVIIVTASPTSDNAIAALRLGAFDFVAKGFENEAMLATVARAVERRRTTVRNRTLISQLEAKVKQLSTILADHARDPKRQSDPFSRA
jgi:DNA-binding response OmpR family regulator